MVIRNGILIFVLTYCLPSCSCQLLHGLPSCSCQLLHGLPSCSCQLLHGLPSCFCQLLHGLPSCFCQLLHGLPSCSCQLLYSDSFSIKHCLMTSLLVRCASYLQGSRCQALKYSQQDSLLSHRISVSEFVIPLSCRVSGCPALHM